MSDGGAIFWVTVGCILVILLANFMYESYWRHRAKVIAEQVPEETSSKHWNSEEWDDQSILFRQADLLEEIRDLLTKLVAGRGQSGD